MNKPEYPRKVTKLILDPGQTSFGFEVPEMLAPAATAEPESPVKKRMGKEPLRPKAHPREVRRRPVRARISFEAPGQLKRKLERAARERDRSKTALLRAALESYLRRPQAEDDEE